VQIKDDPLAASGHAAAALLTNLMKSGRRMHFAKFGTAP
jgi:hypothetical protein